MENLFLYSATAYLAADDSDYNRLEIKVTLDEENFPNGIYCERLGVWLPVGESGESIADVAPIPFVDSARWLSGQGNLIHAGEIDISNERDQQIQMDKDQMLQSYFFDDIKSGEKIIEPDSFTIGFLIERVRSKVKKGFTFYLQEKSKAEDSDNFNHVLVALQATIQHGKPTISYFISLKDGNPCAAFKHGEPIHLRWEGSSVKEYELFADDKRLEIDDKTINEYMIPGENSPKRDTTYILKGTGHLKDTTYQTLTVNIINPALFINENGNVGIGTTSPEKRLDVRGDVQIAGAGPVDYKIRLRGSANESEEGDQSYYLINDKLMYCDPAGLHVAVLSPDGTQKTAREVNVWDPKLAEGDWNYWPEWLEAVAEDGDAVAVMSGRGLHNAPRGGSAERLLNSIGAKKAFDAQREGHLCCPYALLFIKGSSESIEVSQPYKGPNAHIITTYRELAKLPGADLEVDGWVHMKGRRGDYRTGKVNADGQWHNVVSGLSGHNGFEVIASAAAYLWDNPGYHGLTHAIAVNTYMANGESGGITKTQATFKHPSQAADTKEFRIDIRWSGTGENYNLQLRTNRDYPRGEVGKRAKITYYITKLW